MADLSNMGLLVAELFEGRVQEEWSYLPGLALVVSNCDNAGALDWLYVVKVRITNPFTEPPHVEAVLYKRTQTSRSPLSHSYSTSLLMQDYLPANDEAHELWLTLVAAAKLLAAS